MSDRIHSMERANMNYRSGWNLAAACILVASAASAMGQDGAELSPREKQFAASMTNVVLVGQFSIDGKEKGSPTPERYEVTSATKLEGDRWEIAARIKYGKHDVTVPVQLKVLWAGDTPVMTMDDLTIPGMGSFTARVMVHGSRYCGSWQHDAVGGLMWGRIESAKPKAKEPEAAGAQ